MFSNHVINLQRDLTLIQSLSNEKQYKTRPKSADALLSLTMNEIVIMGTWERRTLSLQKSNEEQVQ